MSDGRNARRGLGVMAEDAIGGSWGRALIGGASGGRRRRHRTFGRILVRARSEDEPNTWQLARTTWSARSWWHGKGRRVHPRR